MFSRLGVKIVRRARLVLGLGVLALVVSAVLGSRCVRPIAQRRIRRPVVGLESSEGVARPEVRRRAGHHLLGARANRDRRRQRRGLRRTGAGRTVEHRSQIAWCHVVLDGTLRRAAFTRWHRRADPGQGGRQRRGRWHECQGTADRLRPPRHVGRDRAHRWRTGHRCGHASRQGSRGRRINRRPDHCRS